MLEGSSAAGVWAVLLLAVTPASGQNTNELNAFDFSLPGARSRAMAGAFVAIADDATAVYSNPAGLNLLFAPEVAIEGRRWTLASAIPNRGHAFGRPSGVGIDTLAGVEERAWESDFTGLSFLSFVYPAGNWAVGVFHHQLARYEMERRPQGVFFDCSGGFRGTEPETPFCEPHARDDGVDRIFPKSQTHDLSIRSNGAAVAFHVTDTFTAGVALQRFDFTLTSRNQVYSARGAKKFQAADFSDDNLELDATQQGNDHAWAANVGVLWDISDEWAVGASFRQGPKFTFHARTVTGPQNALETNLPVGTVVADVDDNAFNVPDTYAVGVVFRPSIPWRIGFEYDRVNFGQLFDDFRNVAVPPGDPEGPLFEQQGRLDDADQFRLGAEYTWFFQSESAVALRGGVWHNPQHQTYFESDPATGLPAPRWALLFAKRSGQVHWTSRAGVVLGQHLQIDASIDFSDPGDTFAVSSVWRF